MYPIIRAALAALCITACSDPFAGPVAPDVVFIGVDDDAGPITRVVNVVLSEPGTVSVTWSAPGTPVLTLDSDTRATQHRIVLPRLRAARTYRLDITPRGEAAGSPASTTFATGALPPEVAGLQFTATGTPTHPVSFIEIAQSGTGWLGLLLVEDGEIIGYRRTLGSLFGTARRENGDFVLVDPTLGLIGHRLDGSTPYRLPQPDSAPGAAYGRIHHEVIATPQNTLLFIANETRAVAGQQVTGEAIWEWTPETSTITRRWSAFDHLRWPEEQGPRSTASNWLHGNGLAVGPRGNILMSLRNMDQVISISSDYARLEWRLGGPAATLALPADDRFAGQHSVSAPGPDRLLVFDNGFERTPAFSRAIEYRIDPAAGTATRVWQYRPSPDIYAAMVGSTRRLESGNTVTLFGMLQGHNNSTGPIVALETDASGTERWRLHAGPGVVRVYRATTLPSLLGERTGTFSR